MGPKTLQRCVWLCVCQFLTAASNLVNRHTLHFLHHLLLVARDDCWLWLLSSVRLLTSDTIPF